MVLDDPVVRVTLLSGFVFAVYLGCASMKGGAVDIEIASRTHWLIRREYRVGDGEVLAKVHAEILDYREGPAFVDIEGRARGYVLRVVVSYRISCGNKTYASKRAFAESFGAVNPYGYKINSERARETMLRKIENFLISETIARCREES